MPDENPSTTTPAPAPAGTSDPPATPPAGGAPLAFTPEQQEAVNRIVQQRLTEDRARRPVATPPAPAAAPAARPAPAATPAPVPATDSTMTASEVQQLIARDRAFTRVTATAGLTDRQVERMEAALRAENPADVATWSRDYLVDMGLGTRPAPPVVTPPATQPTTATPAPAAQVAPAAAPAAPSAHTLPTTNGVTDIFQPGVAAILGPAGVRENLEKLWAQGNQMNGAPTRPKPPSQR